MIKKEDVIEALQNIKNRSGIDVVTSGAVSSIVIRGESVGFAIEADLAQTQDIEELRKSCEKAVKKIKGINKVTVVLTSTRKPEETSSSNKASVVARNQETSVTKPSPKAIPGIKKIITVAAGKGGVGKSTIAVNLGVSLANAGYKIGILDADVYGPSIPKMLNLKGKPEIDGYKRLSPFKWGDIQAMSMGNLIEEGKAAVWRGPMATKALYQLFHGVAWNNLDYLIVDLPPGTGDIQLSLAENFPVSGAVIVSTPQEVALLDVRKAMDMFYKVNIPIIGIIENMSYFEIKENGRREYIFGKDGAKKLAQEQNLLFLGEIPILPEIRLGGDSGHPVAAAQSEIADVFAEIAVKITNFLDSASKATN